MKLLRLFVIAILAAATTSFAWRPAPYSGPLEVSFWYWHTPVRISRSEAMQLRQMGVKRLFVRAGTFSTAGGLHLSLPQQWESKAEQQIVLVFNAHTDLLRDFGKLPNDAILAAMKPAIQAQIDRAGRAGIRVSGFQLDIDCPTRLLPKYADLLRALKRANALELSITALPTWLASAAFRDVAGAVDYVVPQFYEGKIARSVHEFEPISSPGALQRGLERMEQLGKPFFAGLPAYGHALAYSGEGKLLGEFSDMDAAQALNHPGLKLIDSFPATASGSRAGPQDYIGEDILKFVPVDMRPDNPDGPDHGMGRKPYYLVYDVPSPAMLNRNLAELRNCRPANCRGVILYRFPGANDPMSLPLTASAEAFHDRLPAAILSVEVDHMNSTWDAIDTGSGPTNSSSEVNLIVKNTGSGGSAVAPAAIEVTLRVNGNEVESVDPGGFNSVESVLGQNRCSLKRANALRFHNAFLAAGVSARIGPIALRSNIETATVEWSVRQPGGFETTTGRAEVRLK